MQAIALLCLIFGFMSPLLLDGQPYTHSIQGIFLGGIAIVCGLVSARQSPTRDTRWGGSIMAILGLILALYLAFQLPSAYRTETRFNQRSKSRQEIQRLRSTPE
jgi:predicted histidine transporter YuiF (NhaC family)